MTWTPTGGLASHRTALREEYSRRGLCGTAAFVYEEGSYRLGPSACQVLWILHRAHHAAASAETGWLQARQEMKGDNDRSAWCMSAVGARSYPRHASSASAFINVAEKKTKKKKEDRQISALTALNSLIAILVRAAGSRTAEAVELSDGKVAAYRAEPLNWRCRRSSALELMINNDHRKSTQVCCGGRAGGFNMMWLEDDLLQVSASKIAFDLMMRLRKLTHTNTQTRDRDREWNGAISGLMADVVHLFPRSFPLLSLKLLHVDKKCTIFPCYLSYFSLQNMYRLFRTTTKIQYPIHNMPFL